MLMRYTPHEMPAHKMHGHEVYAYEMHGHEVYIYKMHAHKIHAHKMYAYEMHAREVYVSAAVGRETALSPFSGVRRTSGCTVKSFAPSFCLFPCSIDHGDTEVAERIRPTEPRWQTATNAYIDVLFLSSTR
jgi:hypothetical protein